MTLITVIIPTYKDWKRLALCLEALGRQTVGPNNLQVLVVDNDPQGEPANIAVPAFARIVKERKPGSYAARNRALSLAEGRYLAFTDSDCIPADDWLENALAILERQPGVRVTGPVSIFRTEATSYLAFLYEFHTAFRQEDNARKGVCVTANLVVARETFDKVGIFNDNLMSGGDFEWNKRAQDLGIALMYAPGVLINHPSRDSLKEILRKRKRIARSDATKGNHTALSYLSRQLRPPLNSLKSGRKYNGVHEVLILWLVLLSFNLYSAVQFLLVRTGVYSPTRS